MKKLKVISVVGTRPEIIRLSRVLAALDQHCDHVLVHTGQNYDYELNQVFFDDLSVRKPDYFLNSAEASTGAAHTIGNLIIAVDRVLGEVQPEAMLVLGDTNSCLSVIPAKRRQIPKKFSTPRTNPREGLGGAVISAHQMIRNNRQVSS